MPLVGQVAAGQPIVAEENIEEYIQTPTFAGGDDGSYLLRVRGESMKDVGILQDDLVVVRPQDTAADGDIVVALVGEEATVKRFFQESDHVRLQPENEAMEPIRSRDVTRARPGGRADEEHLMTVLTTQRRRGRVRGRAAGGADCDRPDAVSRSVQDDAPKLFADTGPGGEPTLEEFISSAWEGLAAQHRVPCPLCGGELTAVFGAHARPAAGRCGDCGTTLS